MDAEPVLFEREGAIARITLNRPEAGKPMDLPMARALFSAALECDADAGVRCVVLTGAGRMFCVGGEIRAFAEAGRARRPCSANLPAHSTWRCRVSRGCASLC